MIFEKVFRPVLNQVFTKTFDADDTFDNLETEDGFNLLQENGDLIILE
jgi:hypothetical protein